MKINIFSKSIEAELTTLKEENRALSEENKALKKSPSGDLTFDGVQNTYLISPVLGSYASP